MKITCPYKPRDCAGKCIHKTKVAHVIDCSYKDCAYHGITILHVDGPEIKTGILSTPKKLRKEKPKDTVSAGLNWLKRLGMFDV